MVAKPINKLLQKMLDSSTIKETATIADSRFFQKKDVITTEVPMINVALSGKVFDGGLVPGSTMLAAPSKHFKSGFALLLARAFLKKYPDGVILFYDSEFGSPASYFQSFGIPPESVVHSPFASVEDLKHDLSVQLNNIERGDHVFIIVDSLGNAGSNKEIEDALDGKSVADMTRAKAIKSLFRIIGTKLVIKDVPLIVVNHTYQTLEMFSKTVVGGGTGSTYGADNIWVISRQQDKNDKTKKIDGYNFVLKIEKSRYCREGAKIPISISFEGGINKWSGLLAEAVEAGFIGQPKKGYYSLINQDTKEFEVDAYKEDSIIDNDAVWKSLLAKPTFVNYIENKYKLSNAPLLDDGLDEEVAAAKAKVEKKGSKNATA